VTTPEGANAALGWTTLEHRWLADLLAAAVPAGASGRPGLGTLPLAHSWSEYATAAPPLLRGGLRIAVWLLTFSRLASSAAWR
jgi:hypothetical protein